MSGGRAAHPDASVRVPILREPAAADLPLPAYATPGSAGLDLCAAVDTPISIPAGGRVAVPTGLRIALPQGYEAQVRPRSGLALRHGILLPNAPGTIDADYRGEVKVILWNSGNESFTVRRGDRIAQLVVAPVARVAWQERSELPSTARGDGGFGHTGRGAQRGGSGA